MNNIVIFQTENSGVGVLYPTPDALELMSITDIAKKDIPKGIPFWYINVDDLPSNRDYRDAWELDVSSMGDPDGYGEST